MVGKSAQDLKRLRKMSRRMSYCENTTASNSHFYFFCLKTIKSASRTIKKEKEIRYNQIGNEEVKLSLFEDCMILCAKNPKESTKKL